VLEPADHDEVLPGAEQPVDAGLLLGDADALPYRLRVLDDVVAGDPRRAAGTLVEYVPI
jgi:hypothetical protein